MGFILLTLTLLVGITHSQIPKPCITPPRWEAKASRYNPFHEKMEHIKLIYDAIMQRQVIHDNILLHPGKRRFEYIILNDVNEMYRIDLESSACVKMRPGPWVPFGIRPGAIFQTEYEIGYPGEDFTAQEWIVKNKYYDTVEWKGVYTLMKCFPVIETFYNPRNKSEVGTTNFYDIIEGIKNPNVFIPPSQCKNAVFVDEEPPFYV